MIKKKFIKILSFLFLLNFSFCLLGQEIDADSKIEDLNITREIPEIDNEELEKLLAQISGGCDLKDEEKDMLFDIAKTPDEMAKRLPDELSKQVLRASEVCGQVLANTHNLFYLMLDIVHRIKQTALVLNEEQSKLTLDIVVKIDEFFATQKFIAYAQHGLFADEVQDKVKEFSFDLDNLLSNLKLNCQLDYTLILESSSCAEDYNTDYFVKMVDVLSQALSAMANNEKEKFRIVLVDFLTPEIENAVDLLDDTEFQLDELQKELSSEEDADLIDAIDFWRDVLRDFSLLRSFGELEKEKRDFWGDLYWVSEKVSPVIPFIVGGYTLSRKVFQFHEIEQKLSFLEQFSDYSIRVLMLPLHVLKRVAEIRKSTTDPMIQRLLILRSIQELSQVFSDSNFYVRGNGLAVRAFYRIASAFTYYNTFYRYNFDDYQKEKDKANEKAVWDINLEVKKKKDKKKTKKKYKKILDAIDNVDFEERDYGNLNKKTFKAWWCPYNKVLRRSTWFAARDAYRTLSFVLERKLKSKYGSSLKKIEDGSAGLLKPDLIRFVANTAMPLLAVKYFPKNILDLNKRDVFSSEIKQLVDLKKYKVTHPFGFAFDYMIGSDDRYYVGNRKFSKISDAEYIRNRVLGYLAVSLGSNLGKKFARKYNKPFRFVTNKGINLVGKGIHKLFSGSLEDFGVGYDSKGSISYVKFLEDAIIQCTDFLIMPEDDGDVIDVVVMNQMVSKMRKIFFDVIVNFKIMSQLEVATFEKDLLLGNINQEKKEIFAKKIVSFFTDELAVKLGGFVGGFTSWATVNYIVNNYSDEVNNFGENTFNGLKGIF